MSAYRTELGFALVQGFLTFLNAIFAVCTGSPINALVMLFIGCCCARSCHCAIEERAYFEEPSL
jgi:hypothetical protein